MPRFLAVLMISCLLAGCGSGGGASPSADVDLADLVTILPTPDGLDLSSSAVRRADAADLQRALAGGAAREESARAYESRGLEDAAIRSWSGPGGARLLVVVSRWPDRLTATAVGAGAADLPLDQGVPGARAWNPDQLRSARGSRVDGPRGRARLLSFAVGDLSLFARADGPIDESVVLRAVQRLARQLDASESG